MNDCILSGSIGKDPEVFAPNGSEYSCLKFSIANNDKSIKNDSGNWQNKTSWFNVEFWTKKPQYWLQKLYKGTPVLLPVEAEQQTWEKDGNKKSKIIFKIQNGKFPYILLKKDDPQNVQTENKGPFPIADKEKEDCPF